MSQPDESREKSPKTDAVLMHPGNDPRKTAAQMPPPPEHGETRVEREGKMVPVDTEE